MADETTSAAPAETAGDTQQPNVQDAGNVNRAPAPPESEVTETEGEEIATTDPQALAKLQRREQRLRRERDTVRGELRTLREGIAAKEQQMADEAQAQTAEQVTNLTRERDEARNETATLKLEKELTGKVRDPEGSIRLMGTGFRKEDGSLDLDAFLEKYPYMRPDSSPTAPDGGGGTQTGVGKDAEITAVQQQLDAAQKSGNRVLAVSLQSKLSALLQR